MHKTLPMRRIVPSRIAEALDRARPTLEEYISRHLEYPLGFPYRLVPAAVMIREVRQFRVAPLAKADLPPVQVDAVLKAWLANRSVRLLRAGWDPGVLDADVQVVTHATVKPDGSYDVVPRSAALKAWWRDIARFSTPG